MIVHVMLVDKKLETTLWAIDLLKHIRPYASVLVLACVAVYSVEHITDAGLPTSRASPSRGTFALAGTGARGSLDCKHCRVQVGYLLAPSSHKPVVAVATALCV